VNSEKTTAVQGMEVPYTLKGVRSFLGLVNYYRRFIPNMAEIVKPLSDLLKKGQNIIRSPADVESLIRQQKKETRAMITGS
ncbi:hypothetical protein ACUWC3_28635, partial [Klebsiella pneumoniae]|uniref:hypothetical protein n=1 Tax=Klebsiella pneumoniae TaxID=573 RepID=UPI004055720A